MTRLIPERTFDPSKPVVTTKSFRAAGRLYEAGQPFDWKKLAVDQRRVRQMFDVRQLAHEDELVKEKAISEKATPVKKKTKKSGGE